MKASLNVMEHIQKCLKNADNSTDFENLSDVIVEMLETETIDDLLATGDAKLEETSDFAYHKIVTINNAGNLARSDVSRINNDISKIIKSSKQDNLEIITGLSKDKQDELNFIVDNFKHINDIPEDSTISNEIIECIERKSKFLDPKNLPFIFGIISRYDDYYDGFTTALGTWYNSSADTMLSLLTGCHSYTTQYSGFYMEPKLCFFQGSRGNFIKKKSYIKHQYSTTIYKHPYAALGCLFVKNVTEYSATSTLNFGGTSYGGTAGGGSSIFVGVPNAETEAITWTNVYSYSSSNSGITNSVSITIPANTSVCVLFYTSSYYIATPTNGTSAYGYHAQFLEWRLNNVRSNFLVDGLEIDFERTLKAWQCKGFANTYELFK